MTDIPTIKPFEEEQSVPESPQVSQKTTNWFFSFEKGQQVYTSWGRRVIDFVVGFFSVVVSMGVIHFVLGFFLTVLVRYTLVPLLDIIVAFALAILAIIYGRKWIALGYFVFLSLKVTSLVHLVITLFRFS